MSAPSVVVSLGQLVQSAQSIASSTTTSPAFATSGLSLVGIQLPAAFTGTAVSFLVATSLAGTYQPLYNSAGQVSYTVAGGRFIAINPQDFYGVQFLKIVSNGTEVATRALTCLLKGL